METEVKKESNNKKGISLLIIVVVMIVSLAAGWFLGGKYQSNKSTIEEVTSSTQETDKNEKDDDEDEKAIEKETCPLTKFDKDYTLTDEDKTKIIEALKEKGKDPIELKLALIGESGYFINVSWQDAGSGEGASLAKVNDEFKVLTTGSGDTAEGKERMEKTLTSICE